LEKTKRNNDLYREFKSGVDAKTLADRYDMSKTNVRYLLLTTYNKLCRAQELEPKGWTLDNVKNDGRVGLKLDD